MIDNSKTYTWSNLTLLWSQMWWIPPVAVGKWCSCLNHLQWVMLDDLHVLLTVPSRVHCWRDLWPLENRTLRLLSCTSAEHWCVTAVMTTDCLPETNRKVNTCFWEAICCHYRRHASVLRTTGRGAARCGFLAVTDLFSSEPGREQTVNTWTSPNITHCRRMSLQTLLTEGTCSGCTHRRKKSDSFPIFNMDVKTCHNE